MTHCSISIKENDKIFTAYCHANGQPQITGIILLENYTDVDKIHGLIKMGRVNCVGKNLHPVPMIKKRSLLDFIFMRKPKEYGLTFDPSTWTYVETTEPHNQYNPWKETTVPLEEFNSEFFEPPVEYNGDITNLEEFNYLFDNGVWMFKKQYDTSWINLQEYLIKSVFGFKYWS